MRFHYFLLLCLPCCAQSQTIVPEGRAIDWRSAGLNNPAAIPGNFVDIVALGADPDGNEPAESVVQYAINQLSEQGGGTIYFPPGSYFFTDAIELRSNILLKGAGSKLTRLKFSRNGAGHLLLIAGKLGKDSSVLRADALLNSKKLLLRNPRLFKPGDYAILFQNDSHLVSSAWAYQTVGQVVKIDTLQKDLLLLRSGLRKDYALFESPWLQKIEPIQNVGIECLKVERIDVPTGASSHFYFDLAVNCWMSGVESERCDYAHVTMHRSSNLLIRSCYFQTAKVYDHVDLGFGVVAEAATGECLVENNIFRGLRHAMVVQSGANGNVFAYNYARESYWNEPFLSFNAAGDLVLHGNYPFRNLFEGNLVQNITIDDAHGLSGPYNTFFRNRAQYYGIAMTFPSERQNFIGNEVINNNVGRLLLVGEEHFLYGNNWRGNIQPANTGDLPDTSLYLSGASVYIQGPLVFPALGTPNALNSGSIVARQNFFNGAYTNCEVKVLTGTQEETLLPAFLLYPNPATDYTVLELPSEEGTFACHITDAAGRLLQRSNVRNGSSLDLTGFPTGVYSVRVQSAHGPLMRKLSVVH